MTSPAQSDARGVSRETATQLGQLADLVTKWQKTHNLVASSTLPDLWTRHIDDSLRLWPAVAPRWRGRSAVDLGSGAGFPGLVLAICARCEGVAGFGPIHLIESSGKKAAFLRHAAQTLGVDVVVHAARIEAVIPGLVADSVGVITARALAPLVTLLDLAAPLLKAGASGVFPKGRRFAVEVAEAKRYWTFDIEIRAEPALAADDEAHGSGHPEQGPVLILEHLRRAG